MWEVMNVARSDLKYAKQRITEPLSDVVRSCLSSGNLLRRLQPPPLSTTKDEVGTYLSVV